MTKGISEVALSGGTTNSTVRVGDTVRRPSTSNSDYVRRVLRGLESVGFERAPKYLGSDEKCRDVLSYVHGYVVERCRPFNCGVWSDKQLMSAARLLRSLHDASVEAGLVSPGNVVCHGDASPANAVFKSGEPYALIDFYNAFEGVRNEDVAYSAWLWLVLGPTGPDIGLQCRRLRLWCDTYGAQERNALLDYLTARQERMEQELINDLRAGSYTANLELIQLHEQREWLSTHRSELLGAIA